METPAFLVVALAILGFGLVSRRAQRSVITPPMVFVLVGLALGARLPFSLEGSPWIETLAELTLVLVLFADATRIDLRLLRRDHGVPVRLLALGMPLTILLGAVAAWALIDGLNIWEAAVLATILAPTDAALGQAVVSSPDVPTRIRQGLNVESGLNDGIALPVLLVLISCAGASESMHTPAYWARFAALQVTLGPLVGVSIGYAGGKLVTFCTRTGWMSLTFQELSAVGLSLLAFATAEMVGGNGFIAAFAAGLTLGNTSREVCGRLYAFAETEGQLLTLLIFMVFGIVMVPLALERITPVTVLYAVLSLTLIRMVPAAIAMLGTRMRWFTVVFLGWFGPRGIASILFAFLVLEGSGLQVGHEILAVVSMTVLLSVFLHGATAYPGARWYARKLSGAAACEEEQRHVPKMPLRISGDE